jgi:hypothetical protein
VGVLSAASATVQAFVHLPYAEWTFTRPTVVGEFHVSYSEVSEGRSPCSEELRLYRFDRARSDIALEMVLLRTA